MYLKRKIKYKNTIFQINIACEGDTEVCYFNDLNRELIKLGFKNVLNIKAKKANRSCADGVVDCAEIYFSSKELRKYKKIYCVFDKDKNTDEQIKKSIKLAKKINAEIIFSNPCFEIWFLSHYKNNIKFIKTENLDNILKQNDKLGENYKSKKSNNYYRLKPKIQDAIKTSRKIYKGEKLKFELEGNPSTDVYKIIEFIESIINRKL